MSNQHRVAGACIGVGATRSHVDQARAAIETDRPIPPRVAARLLADLDESIRVNARLLRQVERLNEDALVQQGTY